LRSSRWTSDIPRPSAYEVRDASGELLNRAETHDEACESLFALLKGSRTLEDDVFVVTLDEHGREIIREDIVDLGLRGV
jgi:hypothetical protein